MNRLIYFELAKMWQKRSFLLSMAALVLVNLFLLWYTNLSDGTEPELSAYRAVQQDMADMTEAGKREYIGQLYQEIQGVGVVQDILQYRAMQGEMGEALARQEMETYPGIFEQYRESYERGEYLRYTDSFEQEKTLIEEIYKEMEQVYGYPEYLAQIRENRDTLQGISIFAGKTEEENFSSRNIAKSAEDYAGLDSVQIQYFPSRGITSAMESAITDILLLLSVFLFAGGAIYEERQKRMYLVIRATVRGRGHSVFARLTALGIHCVAATTLLYAVNLFFFAGTAGIGNLLRSIQSVAPYMESSQHISILTFVVLSLLTKAGALYVVGVFVMLAAVLFRQSFMPYLAGVVFLTVNLLLYWLVPAWSVFNWLKYLNIFGLLDTGAIYGGYLNFNFFEYPVSRRLLTPCVLTAFVLFGVLAVAAAFRRPGEWELAKLRFPQVRRFRPHTSLFRHESYKILFMNRVIVVLLLFLFLTGYRRLDRQYSLSATESYYQEMMLELEGEITPEKEMLISREKERYDIAGEKIRHIEEMIESGEITTEAGETMAEPYYSEMIFYPSFERVLKQYDMVKNGGRFVYDTGYLYLFGIREDDMQMDLLLLSLCVILAFSNVMVMEDQKKSWQLLSATVQGRHNIVKQKLKLCILCTVVIGLVPFVCRFIRIREIYPLRGMLTPVNSIPAYSASGISVPLIVWIAAVSALQVITVVCLTVVVLYLSDRMKHHRQVLFAGAFLLLLPLVLAEMGFSFARWISLYPLYIMPELLLRVHGVIIFAGYAAGAAVLTAVLMQKVFQGVRTPLSTGHWRR